MKKAIITGEKQATVIEVEKPKAVADWVVVKILGAPMCTEYKAYQSGNPAHFLGHEAVGEVVEIAKSNRVKVGDRVVVMPQYPCGKCALCLSGDYIHCQNTADFQTFTGGEEGRATMAQYLLKPDWLLLPIPDGVSYDHASMACCGLGPTFGAMEQMQVDVFDTVLITGLGPVGLGGVINATYRGARVIGVDTNSWRAERAIELGAETVLNPEDPNTREKIMSLTNGIGVDKALDCSGVVAAHRLCIDVTRRRGQIAFVGECHHETPLKISDDMIRKGLTLIGAWHYNLQDSPKIMKVIQESAPKLNLLISHTYPLDNIGSAFDLQLSGHCAKVILKPWEEAQDV
ncbi:MAG: zinc-binding dehydrogenase [Chloroflexota bacterium]